MKIPKLPKLPKVPKLPKLPKMAFLSKLPKLPKVAFLSKLMKGKGGEDDEEFDDDFDFGPEEKTPPEAAPADGDEKPDEAPSGEEGEPDGAPGPEPEGEAPDEAAEEDSPPPEGADEGDEEIVDIDDDEYDFDDDDEDEDGEDSRKPLMIAAAGAIVLVVGMIGGAGWWYFSDDQEPAAATAVKSPVRSRDSARGPSVRMALPPKRGGPKAMLTPPSAGAGKPGASGPASPAGMAKGPEREDARVSGNIGGRFAGQGGLTGGSLNALGAIQEKGTGVVVPAVTQLTIRTLPDHPPAKPLGPTPDARLIEKKEGLPGPLPRIGEDGTTPWEAYKRPYVEETPGARVAIVIQGLGLSRAATMATIGKMPPEITLVLDPYARDLSDWLVRARLVGHEVMLALPMESERFPIHDAGPYSLDTGLKLEDNMKRLELLLSQFSGYFGVSTVMGSRFGTSEEFLAPILQVLKDRGLLFLATGAQADLLAPKIASKIGLPRVISDLTLDDDPSGAAIEAKLARLEEILKERKSAVAVAHPYPSTLARLIVWTKKLKGQKINLVPLSALAKTHVQEKSNNQ